MKNARIFVSMLVIITVFHIWAPATAAPHRQSIAATIRVLDSEGGAVDRIVDGDTLSLYIELAQPSERSAGVQFLLDGAPLSNISCEIPERGSSCQTGQFPALGWRWQVSGEPRPQGIISAEITGIRLEATLALQIAPRPVVLVHGLVGDWRGWEKYLGEDGYLSEIGIQGFAVGDGQAEGVLNTGSLADPKGRTNTIAENARILGEYIDGVRKITGAQQVDLLAHSMGGLISRYYIAKYLESDGVGQLIMLGSPMAGSSCANLPASLGIYLPAVLEIRPSYVRDIFNQQITHRRGVPFYMLAGTQIVKAVQSPCTAVPTDIAVSVSSATSIPLHAEEMPVLHTALNTSKSVFDDFVAPLLKTPQGMIPDEEDPLLAPHSGESEQFTRVYSGKVLPGESQEVEISIEPGVTLATFALFDTTRSLQVRVTGASGKEIALDVEKNGLMQIDDPNTLVYLGYGFENPRPGLWKVALLPSEKTPPEGAQYAITARFTGGARLEAATNTLLPQINEPVRISARLDQSGNVLTVNEIAAIIQKPDGVVFELPLVQEQDGEYSVEWAPDQAGLFGIEVRARAQTADSTGIDRAAFLTVEAQPTSSPAEYPGRVTLAWVLAIGSVIIVLTAVMVILRILKLVRSS